MSLDSDDPRLDVVTSAALTDAVGRRFHHRSHLPELVSASDQGTILGEAATIGFLPARGDLEDEQRTWPRAFHEAIGEDPAGKVLVVSSTHRPAVTLAGGTKLSRLDRWGLAGAVLDGRVRDFEELAELSAGVWCRGEGLRWGGDRRMAVDVDVPVAVGEVTVAPGDLVYADQAGGVVLPRGSADELLDEAVKIEREDEDYKKQVLDEDREAILEGRSAGPSEG